MMRIIVKTIAGSHLYGTNTEHSDIDYKIIYQDSLEDVILKRPLENTRTRAEDKSEETEYIELRKFIKDLVNGQTYAVDMLHTPNDKILKSSIIWKYIVANRREFLSKNCRAFIGYCVTQAKLYQEKGERIRMLKSVLDQLEGRDPYEIMGETLKDIPLVEKEHNRNGAIVTAKYYEILGKYYTPTMNVKDFIARIKAGIDKYGVRSTKASYSEKDWKSIYHAFRTIRELKELATTGHIHFPLKDAKELVEIKLGKWADYKEQRLDWEINSALVDVRASSFLRDSVNMEWVNKFILDCYLNEKIQPQ